MNKNPEVWTEVKEAIETKQFWEGVKEPIFQYVVPGLQLVGGGAQIVGAGAIDVVGCATVVACGLAVGGSSFLVINGLDDIRTGWNNFGGLPEGQTTSSTLTSLGVSEGTAGWVKLGAGGASIGAEAIAINQGLKATTNTFAVGTPKIGIFDGSPHQQLVKSISADVNSSTVVGGTFSRASDGTIIITENSGHFGQNWNNETAQKLIQLLQKTGEKIDYIPWGGKK